MRRFISRRYGVPRRDQRRPNVKLFATQPVVVLRVVTLIAEHFVDRVTSRGLPNRWRKLRRILTRSHADERTEVEVSREIARDRELRIRESRVSAAKPPDVVAAHVAALEARRVDGDAALVSQQADRLRDPKHGSQQELEGPP
jgi:hypothetical protein